jgi:hypothetical protein
MDTGLPKAGEGAIIAQWLDGSRINNSFFRKERADGRVFLFTKKRLEG